MCFIFHDTIEFMCLCMHVIAYKDVFAMVARLVDASAAGAGGQGRDLESLPSTSHSYYIQTKRKCRHYANTEQLFRYPSRCTAGTKKQAIVTFEPTRY